MMKTYGYSREYRLISESRVCEDNGKIQEFGIELVACDTGTTLQACRRISSSHETVQKLLHRLQEYRVSAVHFPEMVEDYLDDLQSRPPR